LAQAILAQGRRQPSLLAMKLAIWWAVARLTSAARLQHRTRERRSDLKLRLANFDGVQYSAALSLGEQTLPVIYDTGSFEIIVLSTLCRTCHQDSIYNSSKSSSFMAADGVIAEHLFGSGPVVSEKGYETVRLGDHSSPYIAEHAPFWQVVRHEIAVWNSHSHFSGIVGLGHPSDVPQGFSAGSTEADSMLTAMHIKSFAFCLERGHSAPGWFSVGPAAEALPQVHSSFQTLEVVGQVHWGVRMTDFQIPGLDMVNPCIPSCGAIVDSGTSLISVPPSATGIIMALSQRIRRDCSNLRALPVLRMKLDGKMIELPPGAYVMRTQRRVNKNSSILRRLFTGSAHDYVNECSAAFMTLDKGSQFGPVWILGMPFLRHYYTVFNRASKKMHFAPSTPSCQIVSQPLTLLNTTDTVQFHEGKGTGEGVEDRKLLDVDYEPMQVDLNSARIPAWANSLEQHISL